MKAISNLCRRAGLVVFFLISICKLGPMSTAMGQPYTRGYSLPYYGLRAATARILQDGNLLVAGIKSARTTDSSLFFVKINTATGDTMWARSVDSASMRLSNVVFDEMDNGDIVVACNQRSLSPTIDTPKLTLLSLNATGALNWVKLYDMPLSNRIFGAPMIRKVAPSKFICCSSSNDTIGVVMVCLNTAGDTVFSRALRIDSTFSGGDYQINDALNTGDGFLFGGTVRFSEFIFSALLVKTDTLGNLQWVRSNSYAHTETNTLNILQMALANDSDVFLSVGSNLGSGIVKTDRNGRIIWSKLIFDTLTYYSGLASTGVIVKTNDGGLMLCGTTDLLQNHNYSTPLGKQAVLKLDSAGNEEWAKKYEFAINANQCVFAGQLPDGSIVTAGTVFHNLTNPGINEGRLYVMQLDAAGQSAAAGCGADSAYAYQTYNQANTMVPCNHTYYSGFGLRTEQAVSAPQHLAGNADTLETAVALFAYPDFSICEGQMIYFNAVALNAGTGVNYDFEVNGTIVQSGPSPNYATSGLAWTDSVACILSGAGPCGTADSAVSNSIVPLIYPTSTPVVTVLASPPGPVAAGTTVTFSVSALNEGPTPTFVWSKNSIRISSGPQYVTNSLANGDIISCQVTNNNLCSGSPTGVGSLTEVVYPVGVPNMNIEASILLSPNPAQAEVMLTGAANSEVVIVDGTGREVARQQVYSHSENISVRNLPQGIYLFIITRLDTGTRVVRQLTKE